MYCKNHMYIASKATSTQVLDLATLSISEVRKVHRLDFFS